MTIDANPYQPPATPMVIEAPHPVGPCPPSHLVWAILAGVVGTPLGIPAIIYASHVEQHWRAGDLAAAQRCARRGLAWSLAAYAACLIVVLLSLA